MIALAQAREGRPDPMRSRNPSCRFVDRGFNSQGRSGRTPYCTGTVRDASGKPVEGASIVAVGALEFAERANGWYFTHHGEEQQILAQTPPTATASLSSISTLDPAVLNVDVIAVDRHGASARNYNARPRGYGDMFFEPLSDRPVELTLLPNVPIEGRLLSQTGKPVSGVSVVLTVLELGETRWVRLWAARDGEGRAARTPTGRSRS